MVIDYFEDKKSYDCYAINEFGVFVPILENRCKLSAKYSYPCYEILIDFNEAYKTLRKNKAYITSPEVIHQRKGCRHCYIILCGKDYFEKRYKMYGEKLKIFNQYEFEISLDMLNEINSYIFEYSNNLINYEMILDAHIEIIIHRVIRSLKGELSDLDNLSTDYAIAKLQQYIEMHYMEHLTVKELSKVFAMSEATLNRKFKKEIGITPIEYLINIRIKKSKNLLKSTENSVTEIANECGFSNASHYSTCFMQKNCVTPLEYRKRFKFI